MFGAVPPRADFPDACVSDVGTEATPAGYPLIGFCGRGFWGSGTSEGAASGNADALTVLFERHASSLFRIARRILRNEAEAEDAVQQTFLDVFRSIQQWNPEKGGFKTWLLSFAYQRISNCRRSLAANRFFNTDPFDELLPAVFPLTERH